ncbi:MAG: MarR family transcriptional regulator [Alphaproteobacteria bacterium]|nr:MarR family transcriptional regulator [Alphaproteobacteria bacterium]
MTEQSFDARRTGFATAAAPLSQQDYESLARFRHALRQFLAFSDEMLASVNLGPRRYQALLAIRAHRGPSHISVGELARLLIIRPNTAAELVNRLELAGLIERVKDPHDRRRALLTLTPEGARRLSEVAEIHFRKLQESRADFIAMFEASASQDGATFTVPARRTNGADGGHAGAIRG